jgi:hypothetical protein
MAPIPGVSQIGDIVLGKPLARFPGYHRLILLFL